MMGNNKNTQKGLPSKQLLFVDRYFELSFNGTEAYIQAYPHVKKHDTARAAASHLLTNVTVFEEVEQR